MWKPSRRRSSHFSEKRLHQLRVEPLFTDSVYVSSSVKRKQKTASYRLIADKIFAIMAQCKGAECNMKSQFFYIVITIQEEHYFINRDMDYTDTFDDVRHFSTYGEAEDHIQKHGLADKHPRILEFK